MTPIISPELPAQRPELMQRITVATLRDESEHVEELLKTAPLAEFTALVNGGTDPKSVRTPW